ncbi:uncharacterized protein PGRI_062240 [Penicillium griseofulvum]|uniref:Uncharacterized protein n=1 Tax=Penicillium patulum TaxID=5078 RepID=A0A135LMR6_PENPA|nr:uncharacterized protein PGRI_062240 [Penicillium griseofulvum]KXG50257.1 hypothetical protein PGRI_062240 [Penicillium griseofulvum]
MSGLEIIALIPAIVSAFGTISVEYRDWRKRRDDRRNKSKNVALQKLLAGNGETVQNEYDEDLRLLGPVFQRGDSTGRESLMHHLIILQSTVISLMRDRHNDMSYLSHPNHDAINNTTKSTRNGIVNTLSDQYQRLAQARPIARLPAPATSSAENCFNDLSCATFNTIHNTYKCDDCGWGETYSKTTEYVKTKDGQLLDIETALALFHHREPYRKEKNVFRCYLCEETINLPTGMKGWWSVSLESGSERYVLLKELEKHVRRNHYFEELA